MDPGAVRNSHGILLGKCGMTPSRVGVFEPEPAIEAAADGPSPDFIVNNAVTADIENVQPARHFDPRDCRLTGGQSTRSLPL